MMTVSCQTCQLVTRRDSGSAPDWDNILRTPGWDLVHSFNTSLEGWLVLVARRHIASLAEMTEAEADELGPLVRKISGGLHRVTGCEKTYMIQFAESPDHRHVHVHLVPRMTDQPPELRGPGVFGFLGAEEGDRVGEIRMNQLAEEIRAALAT